MRDSNSHFKDSFASTHMILNAVAFTNTVNVVLQRVCDIRLRLVSPFSKFDQATFDLWERTGPGSTVRSGYGIERHIPGLAHSVVDWQVVRVSLVDKVKVAVDARDRQSESVFVQRSGEQLIAEIVSPLDQMAVPFGKGRQFRFNFGKNVHGAARHTEPRKHSLALLPIGRLVEFGA
jgi:hypothetical protein